MDTHYAYSQGSLQREAVGAVRAHARRKGLGRAKTLGWNLIIHSNGGVAIEAQARAGETRFTVRVAI